MSRLSKADWLACGVLWISTFSIFAAGAGRLGFYADDSGWMLSLPSVSSSQLWNRMVGYMPGRNLHVLWHWSLYRLVGNPVTHLRTLHLVQSAVDGIVVVSFFLLLRLLELPGYAAALPAALFSFWPRHGETHFWLESLPMNLLSTVFVIAFAMTSLALARGPGWRWWAVDAAAFLSALFTYDQVIGVLTLLCAARAVARRSWRFALLHLPYAATAGFWIWWRLEVGGGPTPLQGTQRLIGNITRTLRETLGEGALVQTVSLCRNATAADWTLAALVAVALGWLVQRKSGLPRSGSGRNLALALGCGVAAYSPVWLWSVSPRHHYLPSLGWFAAAAIALTWLLDQAPKARTGVLLVLAGAVGVMAAANRGESRFWELAFSAKRQLLSDIKPDLEGRQILVLEDFPYFVGPALLIAPHDARFAPSLLYGKPSQGVVGAAPAPRGWFVSTYYDGSPPTFFYVPERDGLVVRFNSWNGNKLSYTQERIRVPPYEWISSHCAPLHSLFAAHQTSARRDGDDLIVSLRIQAPLSQNGCLAAVFRFVHGNGFYPWSQLDLEGNAKLLPVLLVEDGPGWHCDQTLRLKSFPKSDRLQVEYYEAGRKNPPKLLGRVETAVEP